MTDEVSWCGSPRKARWHQTSIVKSMGWHRRVPQGAFWDAWAGWGV